MIKLYEELVKLCMVCMQTQYRVRDLNSLSSQDLGGGGGGNLLHYPGCGFMRGHRQMAWGEELKWNKPIPCMPGRRGYHY